METLIHVSHLVHHAQTPSPSPSSSWSLKLCAAFYFSMARRKRSQRLLLLAFLCRPLAASRPHRNTLRTNIWQYTRTQVLEAKRGLEGQLAGLQRANEDRSIELGRVRDGRTPTMTTIPTTTTTAEPATTAADVGTIDKEAADEFKADIEAEVRASKRAHSERTVNERLYASSAVHSIVGK